MIQIARLLSFLGTRVSRIKCEYRAKHRVNERKRSIFLN